MIVTIHPSRLKGTVQAPASKSAMQRALAAALLNRGKTIIHNPGHSDDDHAASRIIELLGADLDHTAPALVVRSKGFPLSIQKPVTIDCGESGLSIRMFTPIAALSEQEITITGRGSLISRPMDFFDEVLPLLGVSIQSTKGKLPLVIKGPLQTRDIEIDGSLSSQFLTGLIIAYAGSGAKNVTIKVNDLKSRPYIDLTLEILKTFGFKAPINKDYREFYFDDADAESVHGSTGEKKHTVNYVVESDWSGGAFLLVAGAIAGPITVRGLDLASVQADKAIIEALMSANAGIAMEAKGIKIRPGEMKGFQFDATDCPDLFPPLVALAAYCKGRTTIKGVSRLQHKESNRALTLQEEFDRMGVLIKLERDEMLIQGNGIVKGADVHSNHDHRIAMACAVAALGADTETTIEDAGAVSKSYPDFFNDIKYLGAKLTS